MRKSIANLVGFFFCVDLIVLEKTCRPSVNKMRMTGLQNCNSQKTTLRSELSCQVVAAEKHLKGVGESEGESASSLSRVTDEGETLERVSAGSSVAAELGRVLHNDHRKNSARTCFSIEAMSTQLHLVYTRS